jgi:preprotein translocase SecE subunit
LANRRYVLLTFIVAAILVGLTVQAASVSGFAELAYPDNRLLGLLNTSTALALASGAVSFGVMIRTKKAITFTDEVVGELNQVIWPTRDETVRASTTVVLTTLFTAGLLAFYDLIWKNLADIILFTG